MLQNVTLDLSNTSWSVHGNYYNIWLSRLKEKKIKGEKKKQNKTETETNTKPIANITNSLD